MRSIICAPGAESPVERAEQALQSAREPAPARLAQLLVLARQPGDLHDPPFAFERQVAMERVLLALERCERAVHRTDFRSHEVRDVVDPREEFRATFGVPDATLLTGMPDDMIVALRIDTHTAIVGLSHDPKLDDMALMEALKSPAFYIGALGSRLNTRKRKERLLEFDLSREQVERLQGPTGLFIGSRTPAEMAISILAEVTAAKYQVPILQRRAIPVPELIERARGIDALSAG